MNKLLVFALVVAPVFALANSIGYSMRCDSEMQDQYVFPDGSASPIVNAKSRILGERIIDTNNDIRVERTRGDQYLSYSNINQGRAFLAGSYESELTVKTTQGAPGQNHEESTLIVRAVATNGIVQTNRYQISADYQVFHDGSKSLISATQDGTPVDLTNRKNGETINADGSIVDFDELTAPRDEKLPNNDIHRILAAKTSCELTP